jgi:CRISPR-associated protein Csx10
MKALIFNVRLLQPLLVTQVGAGEENSSTSFDFIPGSVLRGDLLNRYLQTRCAEDAAQDPTCRRLFFDGAVRYLNAYPSNRLGHRMLPTPLSWRVSKEDQENPRATIYDLAIRVEIDVNDLTPLSAPFWWGEEEQIEFSQVGRHISAHNASDKRMTKRKGDSTVYQYEAIASGETLSAAIVSDREEDLEMLQPFLDGAESNLGGSRNAGYGHVRFEKVQLTQDWHEYKLDEDPEENIVIVTLLSDTLLRDKNGQPTTDLCAVLGWKPLAAYQRTRIVGGFNRKWGLPLVQVPALQAGSVFVYQANQVDRKILQKLEQEGIGERCTEGFGRLAVNLHTQETLQRRAVPKEAPLLAVQLSAESQVLAKQMAERRFRTVLDQKLIEAISQLSITRPPTNAQLSRLRLSVRRAWREEKPQMMLDHLNNLNPVAKDQLERAWVDNKRLLSWLMTGIQQNKIWEDYLKPDRLPALAGVTAEPTAQIKLEYTARLLDALMKKTTKEAGPGGAK